MAAAGCDECMCTVINIECSKENVNSQCLCCVKLKDELQRVVSELKSVVEIVKILKDDQEQLSLRVDNIECTSDKRINTVNNASSNAFHLTD
jgi:formate-dependent nitrite reductase cytochrome c552 subunit